MPEQRYDGWQGETGREKGGQEKVGWKRQDGEDRTEKTGQDR